MLEICVPLLRAFSLSLSLSFSIRTPNVSVSCTAHCACLYFDSAQLYAPIYLVLDVGVVFAAASGVLSLSLRTPNMRFKYIARRTYVYQLFG